MCKYDLFLQLVKVLSHYDTYNLVTLYGREVEFHFFNFPLLRQVMNTKYEADVILGRVNFLKYGFSKKRSGMMIPLYIRIQALKKYLLTATYIIFAFWILIGQL